MYQNKSKETYLGSRDVPNSQLGSSDLIEPATNMSFVNKLIERTRTSMLLKNCLPVAPAQKPVSPFAHPANTPNVASLKPMSELTLLRVIGSAFEVCGLDLIVG